MLSLIIPVYRNEASIPELLTELQGLHQALTGVWSKPVAAPEAPPVPTTPQPGAAPADVAAATAAAQAAAQQWATPPPV